MVCHKAVGMNGNSSGLRLGPEQRNAIMSKRMVREKRGAIQHSYSN